MLPTRTGFYPEAGGTQFFLKFNFGNLLEVKIEPQPFTLSPLLVFHQRPGLHPAVA